MSDLAKTLAENRKERLKLIAPLSKKQPVHPNDQIVILSLRTSPWPERQHL